MHDLEYDVEYDVEYEMHDVEYQTGAVIQRLLQVSYIHRDFLKRVLTE